MNRNLLLMSRYILFQMQETCEICNQSIKGGFIRNPFYIFLSLLDEIHFTALPSTLEIDGLQFNPLCLLLLQRIKIYLILKASFIFKTLFTYWMTCFLIR